MIQCFTSYADVLIPLTFLQCVCHYRLLDKFKTLSKDSCIQVCNNKKNRFLRAPKWKLSSSWCLLTAHWSIFCLVCFWLNYVCAFPLKVSYVPVRSAVLFGDRNCSDLFEAFSDKTGKFCVCFLKNKMLNTCFLEKKMGHFLNCL